MDADIKTLLSVEDPEDAFHKALLRHAKRLMGISRASRRNNYDNWELQQSVFKGEMVLDKDDVKKAAEGRPTKAVLPTAYAQIMTFVSFHFLQFNQQETFFNLRPTGDEDFGQKKNDLELVLEFQLNKNDKNARLFQSLLDIGRFGEAAMEVSWTKEMMKAWVARQKPAPAPGPNGEIYPAPDPVAAWEDYTKYEGNRVRNISPFRFFPDTRHALCDFQKGEFCALEEEFSMTSLYELEAAGEVAGVKYILPMVALGSVNGLAEIMNDLRGALRGQEKLVTDFSSANGSSLALVTKMQVWIIPSKFKLKDYSAGEGKVVGGKPVKNKDGEWVLGTEDHKILYHLWYANGNRVIRMEQAKWWHNEFGYTVGQFTPDLHQNTSFGLAELIYPIQEFQSWFMNSHVASVDRVIDNRLIINESLINTNSLDGKGDIYLRKGVAVPPDRAVGQLRIQDVTGNHMNDVGILGDVIEQVTGVNKMMQGQSSSGRRSSFQDRTVAGGAASRMKMHGALIWESLLGRMGRLMLSNARQSLSFESFVRVIGKPSKKVLEQYKQASSQWEMQMQQLSQAVMQNPALQQQIDPSQIPPRPVDPMEGVQDRYDIFKGEPEEVICGDDFMIYDNTMPQDRGMMAQSLQELLITAMQNPEMAVQLDLSAKAILEEMLRLRDAGPVSRFSLKRRVEEGLDTMPPPPVQDTPQPQQAAGPQTTNAPQTHITHAPVAPVIHIHNPKPASS